MAHLALAERVEIPLYISVSDDAVTRIVEVDFCARRVSLVPAVGVNDRYELAVPAWQIASVLDGRLTWEEFALTFRMRLFRVPDAYQPILHAFLILEPEDLDEYCRMLVDLENNRERITVEVNGAAYSVLRYCPHQGGDMKEAWIDANGLLTCPRHRWQFDCANGGRCTTNDSSIDAQPVECLVT